MSNTNYTVSTWEAPGQWVEQGNFDDWMKASIHARGYSKTVYHRGDVSEKGRPARLKDNRTGEVKEYREGVWSVA